MPGPDGGDRMTAAHTLPETMAKSLSESAQRSVVTGKPDPAALRLLRESGLLATAVPQQFGGAGGDASDINEVVRLLAAENPSVAIIAFQHFAVCARIAEWGTTAQHRELLPRLADGTWLAASAWSEPGAGAAKQRISTTGRRCADGRWSLDGAKSFATGATVADVYLVLVQTGEPDPAPAAGGYGASGQTFFLVEAGTPGLDADLGLDLAGMRGSATGRVVLRDCVVGDDRRLGPEGAATRIIAGVRQTGATLGAVGAGIAEAALELVLDHCRRRGTIEAAVSRRQLVDLRTEVEAVRAVVERAGARTSDPGLTTLHSKLYASQAAERICLEAARFLGAAGYSAAGPVNRLLADARAVAMMGPTNDLCRDLVAAGWLR